MKAQRDHVTCTGSHGLGIGVQDSTARLPPPTSSQGYTGFDEESLRSKGVGLPPQLNSTQVLWAHAETVNANALSRCFSLSLVHWDPELDPPPTGPRRGQRLVPQPPPLQSSLYSLSSGRLSLNHVGSWSPGGGVDMCQTYLFRNLENKGGPIQIWGAKCKHTSTVTDYSRRVFLCCFGAIN